MAVNCYPTFWAPKELSYFTAITSVVLCIIITSGNSLIISAVIVDPLKKLRTPFSYFLINLAISDVVVGLVTMPVSYVIHTDEANGHIPQYKIILLHVSYFVSSTASVLSLGALSIDRFVAIRWPIKYRKRLSLLRCVCLSFAIWVFAGVVSLAYLKIGYINHLMVFAHVSVLVTFILLVITYREVYKAFRKQANELRGFHNAATGEQAGDENSRIINEIELRRVRTEKKVTRAYLFILGFFIVCYLPVIVMIYILQFCETCSCDLRHTLRDLQFIIVSINSAINPFVCTIRLGPFRRSIIAVITCKKFRANSYVTRNENTRGIINLAMSSNKESSDVTS